MLLDRVPSAAPQSNLTQTLQMLADSGRLLEGSCLQPGSAASRPATSAARCELIAGNGSISSCLFIPSGGSSIKCLTASLDRDARRDVRLPSVQKREERHQIWK
jgi:hypothetical protein